MDWADAYASAVDEVNEIERAVLGRWAIDLPSRPNPSRPLVIPEHLAVAYFERRPVTYFANKAYSFYDLYY